jgi:hypothetical protein
MFIILIIDYEYASEDISKWGYYGKN